MIKHCFSVSIAKNAYYVIMTVMIKSWHHFLLFLFCFVFLSFALFSYKLFILHVSLIMTATEVLNVNWKIIFSLFQLVTRGGQEKTFDSRICAWANRLTDELINNTLANLMRHWFPLRSMPLMPTLMWRHRCSHPQSKHIGRSLAGAPCSPLSCRDEAEIFSIKSTWSQCHHFPLQFSSWLAANVHTHRRSHLHINACMCSTSFHQ